MLDEEYRVLTEKTVIRTGDPEAQTEKSPHREFPIYDYRARRMPGRPASGSGHGEDESADVQDRPGFWKRFGAALIDAAAYGISGVFLVSLLPEEAADTPVFFAVTLGEVLFLAIRLVYETVTTVCLGASAGKTVCGMCLADRETGERPPVWKILFRESVGKYLSLMSLGIGFFMIGSKKGALHDRLSDTEVVWKR